MTDAAGIPLSIVVAPANRHDSRLFLETLLAIVMPRPVPDSRHPQGLNLDKAYESHEIEEIAHLLHYELHLRRKGELKRKHKRGKARRYVVERTHSWLNRKRSVLIRWEKDPDNYEAMIHIAAALTCFQSSGYFKFD